MATTVPAARALDLSRSGPWFAFFLLATLIAFWPSYVSLPLASSSRYTHFHAFTATLWMLLLIAQPLAIRKRRLPLHRTLGRVSYVIAPMVVVSMLLLAHSRMQGLFGERHALQTYILYLQLSLTLVFALSYALAIVTRRKSALHARFMVCTALTLVDPVVVRVMLWIGPVPTWNYQWLTFGLTDLVFVALIWLERHSRVGRAVFPAMLAVFVASQGPALFLDLTTSARWQAFAAWFAARPLT